MSENRMNNITMAVNLNLSQALDMTLPVYGKGENVRDWLYVVDHALCIW